MPSPFPGMDPYLEGYLWPDVHQALAGKIRQYLTPLVRPRYTVRLAVYVVEDHTPEREIGVMYPASPDNARVPTPETRTFPVMAPVAVQIVRVEIRDTAANRLVTCVAMLSPVNTREPNLTPYRQKRQRLYAAGVHVLALDLLRRGTRPMMHPRMPSSHYLIALTRAQVGTTALWSLTIRDTLPCVPVPLQPPDDDVVLDLSDALALMSIYDEAAYDLSIEYQQPPPPPDFADADQEWMCTLESLTTMVPLTTMSGGHVMIPSLISYQLVILVPPLAMRHAAPTLANPTQWDAQETSRVIPRRCTLKNRRERGCTS